MTIYIVTSGEYSAYRIERVFTDIEKAHAYVGDAESTDPSIDIEEWGADVETDEVYRATHVVYLNRETGERLEQEGVYSWRTHVEHAVHPRDWSDAREFLNTGVIGGFSVVSEEHAFKVAVEKRQEWLRTPGNVPLVGGLT